MEVRVEAAPGTDMPVGCHISVRVGDVLKQGRYEPQRCYNFTQPERRKNAKIDIYQHIGTAVVAVDPDAKSQHEVKVSANEPAANGMRLQVHVQSKAPGAVTKPPREERVVAMKSKAKEYLTSHRIEERLSEVVKALLKEQPPDPTEFLCRKLREDNPEDLKPAATNMGSVQKQMPVLPFAGYYQRYMKKCVMPASAYSAFPAKGSGRPAAPSNEKQTPMFPFTGYYQRYVKKCVIPASAYHAFPPKGSGRPVAPSNEKHTPVVPFSGYYQRYVKKCVMPASAYRAFPPKGSGRPAALSAEHMARLRKEACSSLNNACDSGELKRVLSEARQKKKPEPNLEHLRSLACNVLSQASDNGDLERAILRSREERPRAAGTSGRAAAGAPLLVSIRDVMGPSFAAMGLRPNVFFI